ncbi:hypothetical protein C8R43DRAFT_548469 [Mycena crocata]|nr:hypothetical protein C8R43DRAFT_548469 [Mycena crocata]
MIPYAISLPTLLFALVASFAPGFVRNLPPQTARTAIVDHGHSAPLRMPVSAMLDALEGSISSRPIVPFPLGVSSSVFVSPFFSYKSSGGLINGDDAYSSCVASSVTVAFELGDVFLDASFLHAPVSTGYHGEDVSRTCLNSFIANCIVQIPAPSTFDAHDWWSLLLQSTAVVLLLLWLVVDTVLSNTMIIQFLAEFVLVGFARQQGVAFLNAELITLLDDEVFAPSPCTDLVVDSSSVRDPDCALDASLFSITVIALAYFHAQLLSRALLSESQDADAKSALPADEPSQDTPAPLADFTPGEVVEIPHVHRGPSWTSFVTVAIVLLIRARVGLVIDANVEDAFHLSKRRIAVIERQQEAQRLEEEQEEEEDRRRLDLEQQLQAQNLSKRDRTKARKLGSVTGTDLASPADAIENTTIASKPESAVDVSAEASTSACGDEVVPDLSVVGSTDVAQNADTSTATSNNDASDGQDEVNTPQEVVPTAEDTAVPVPVPGSFEFPADEEVHPTASLDARAVPLPRIRSTTAPGHLVRVPVTPLRAGAALRRILPLPPLRFPTPPPSPAQAPAPAAPVIAHQSPRVVPPLPASRIYETRHIDVLYSTSGAPPANYGHTVHQAPPRPPRASPIVCPGAGSAFTTRLAQREHALAAFVVARPPYQQAAYGTPVDVLYSTSGAAPTNHGHVVYQAPRRSLRPSPIVCPGAGAAFHARIAQRGLAPAAPVAPPFHMHIVQSRLGGAAVINGLQSRAPGAR